MIDISTAERSQYPTTVYASDNIFQELGKNTYDYKDLLSELIDNSIAARYSDRLLEVTINIYVDDNNNPVKFIINDNAGGIPVERLGQAIAPAGIQSANSLNEHGLGMKQAVAALGRLEYLATKVEGEGHARLIQEFKFGSIETFYVPFEQESGTEISVVNLNPIVTTNAGVISRSILPYLGARYRRFLRPDNKSMKLEINIRSATNPTKVHYNWSVKEVKPIYFHPSTRTNHPVILDHLISGTGWQAKLTFGYAPKVIGEYEELGLEEPNRFQPYRHSLTTQGLDIILHDRVILFHQLSELGIVHARHSDYNSIRGEIELIKGFSTAITKNSMIFDNNFRDCIERIKGILRGEIVGPTKSPRDYLKLKTYPDEIPEKLLRDRLVEWLLNNPLHSRDNVQTEYVIEGIEGFIDIFADKEAWEIKTDQANALDVYQLFMYMDVGRLEKGYLVANNFSTGAKVAVEHIKNIHNKAIVLAKREQFPINQPPTDTERQDYY